MYVILSHLLPPLLLLPQPWETAKVSEGVRLQSPEVVRGALTWQRLLRQHM